MARLLQFLALALASLALMTRPALAQQILRDAETEAFMADMSAPLVKAAGMTPKNVQVLVINDPEINAFVAGGQYVWVHSGLIAQADNVNQLQGVVAHELGHIEGGHIIRSGEGIKDATSVTLLSLVLGAAAIAAGGAEAGMGIMGLGQQAAMSKFLAFSRAQESSADLAGARYLHSAGISGRGSLEFFKKLQNQEYRLAIPQDNSYGRTHPLSGERISVLREVYEVDPAWDRSVDPQLEARFERIKAKLIGFVSEPQQTLIKYPESDQSLPAHYARAYAWHKSAYPQKALAEADALLAAAPHDPYFLELKGQILLESGRPADAIAPLREAVKITNQPLISVLLSHALIATEDPANFAEAEQVLRVAVQRDRENPFAWYQLGVVYERRGDTPRAALATAERYAMMGDHNLALRSADVAVQGLQPGTVDYLRAQDIAMTSRAAVEQQRKKR
ncbi:MULTISPECIES: M48 family metalloprotease [Sphingobium]|jgi:predicted Zn-dependent protease|uniref:M48 family metalloprotease n=1 Tax=Sphingobium TaxID=165695 RepID=UPI000C5EB4E0|nr:MULTISPECIES: M48 family metalloprotease [Sphingobium]MBA37063.1 peptidase M48 [Sphingobium sp.]MBS48636.1 peptidase M48 [Sphingobium sp.]MCC4255799.1 M48 family metalloprotease [Sphingobium lactosutens]|tara:strand:- start:75 stop:1424 length:1350 start_codon:yes stop_codon:yes gene_type:complete